MFRLIRRLTVLVFAAIALVILGWQIARDVGRSLGPLLLRRLDAATAGTVGFLIRLVTMLVAVVVALRVAKLDPRTLADDEIDLVRRALG